MISAPTLPGEVGITVEWGGSRPQRVEEPAGATAITVHPGSTAGLATTGADGRPKGAEEGDPSWKATLRA